MSDRRYYNFSPSVRGAAFARQQRRCAVCGESLADLEDRGHHIIPVQSGNAADPSHEVIKSVENCAMLCVMCHDEFAHQSDTREGAVPPPSQYPYSHGGSKPLHAAWAKRLGRNFTRIMNERWAAVRSGAKA